MADDTKAVLHRLKRRIGKERARAEKLEKTYFEKKDSFGRERAMGEANVLGLAMGFIDEELRKLP